ncbi:tRNA (adenosine(37)-N6)-threonylcarbamoyltransferase complex ATPase subunit type 1 TsaE [Steroidobacter sp.]|uniref:tRNA (adenosine(37)-N6)-threonylcarbamoyltransferase complex ATPase subunit type 1 TsaE n=1 Tax=Steroidobacter sp. TaxID=1978227 RepID=UPI001A3A2156|nr:tRNA (adenosine(37)-N6)-threonylcarbamoyltransferase complex ATPase subunit type 1 TsaE [Steroidobacter sp.]MBL8269797.1 tRNA (adenosine(37)-N6)-threonylcarbamoyltransferase complex ATPase subunit type 1 TsaE [Steroidobacter sp.]
MREPGTEILSVASAERMQALGRAIGSAVDESEGPFIIALEGELGAGKTTLVGGFMRAYGITGPVRSPTYTLIEPYQTASRAVYHLDLYRLVDPNEVEPLGIRDLLAEAAVLLIEWPSKAAGALPAADLWIDIAYPARGTEGREVRLTSNSPIGTNALRDIVAAIPELRLLSP